MEEKTLQTKTASHGLKKEEDEVTISSEEWNEISKNLEERHALFYQCWQMGRPRFTTEISTAAIGFNQEGEYMEFVFNPIYWKSLTDYERLFTIGHECLHVILNHGSRAASKEALKENKIINVAMDIVVNHILVNSFGFDRDKIKDWEELCWVETVFKKLGKEKIKTIPNNQSFEYYYNLIKEKNLDEGELKSNDHSNLPNNWNDVIDKLNKDLNESEKDAIKPLIEKHYQPPVKQEKGTGTGGWTFINVEFKKSKKWESIINNWAKKYLKREIESKEQWIRLNRRFSMLADNLFLPTEMEDECDKKDKIPVFMFIDTSGSCYSFKQRFINLAASMPEDIFELRVFTFDTTTEEVDMKGAKSEGRVRFYGWGGTSFSIIEQRIQKEINCTGEDYPEAVFIITDGFGGRVNPLIPNRWHWLLTPSNTKTYIPKESKIYDLKQFC